MALSTDEYDLPRLLKFQAQLNRVSETLSRAVAQVDQSGEPLWVFKSSSQEIGIGKLLAFEQELDNAVISARSGLPNKSDTRKPRATVPNIPGVQRASEMEMPPDEEAVGKNLDRVSRREATRKKATDQAKSGRKKKSG